MALDINTVFIVLAAAVVWLLLSYGTYRLLAAVPVSKRNWIWRTRARRIAWVIFSPLLWTLLLLLFLDEVFLRRLRDGMKQWWNNTRPKREEKRHQMHARRHNFLFDPTD